MCDNIHSFSFEFQDIKSKLVSEYDENNIDVGILPYVRRVNELEHFCTRFSCEGHENNPGAQIAFCTDLSVDDVFSLTVHIIHTHDIYADLSIGGIGVPELDNRDDTFLTYSIICDTLDDIEVLVEHMEYLDNNYKGVKK